MAEAAINQGSLRAIFENPSTAPKQPVMQCVQIKAMDNKAGDTPRYRVVLSDIRNFIQTMLAKDANNIVTNGELKKGSIVRLKQFNPQSVKDKKILIILDLEVLEQYGELDKIGSPVQLDPTPKAEDNQQPAGISSNGFYGQRPAQPAAQQPQQPQQQQQQQQERSLPSHPHNQNAQTASHPHLYPIESISPYQHKWTIRVRCTYKSDIKTWHNKNGEGKLFSVNFLDETGEIRATGFNEQCDMLYDLFQEGGVYYVSSPCRVTLAKKQFSNLNNDYELHFEKDTLVDKAEDTADAPQVRYNFSKIGGLGDIEKDTLIDAIGVLKEVGEVSEIVSQKTSKPFSKRELTIADDTMTSVRLTIWGNNALSFDAPLESVLAFKGLKVSDFGGRSLSLLSSGSMSVDPDIDEAHKLKGWYDAVGRQGQYSTHQGMGGAAGGSRKQEYKVISQIKDEELGISEEPTYFNLKASVVYVKHDNFAYPACQSENCSKKVIEENPGEWRCERCDKAWPRPQYRYIMSVNVSDHTGQLWLSAFDEPGRIIMARSADDLTTLKEQDDENGTTRISDAFQDATCQTFNFRVRAKMDNHGDQARVRYQIQAIHSLNFPQECARLVEILKQYDMNSDSLFVQ